MMTTHPHTVYAGTSGWAYASWKPGFYPAKTPAARMLAYYASQLNSVEVNFTFRQLPTEKQLTKLAGRNVRRVSLLLQSSAGDYTLETAARVRRRVGCIEGIASACRTGGEAGRCVVSIAA